MMEDFFLTLSLLIKIIIYLKDISCIDTNQEPKKIFLKQTITWIMDTDPEPEPGDKTEPSGSITLREAAKKKLFS